MLINPDAPGYYHLISRCVRRSWLCGRDRGRDYAHRRAWLVKRLKQLGRAFALDVHAYAIMSNHFHLVVYSDPTEPRQWSDTEVIDRWLSACPPRDRDGQVDGLKSERLRRNWLDDSEHMERLRQKLGSVSVFMKLLKQPIARRANLEDHCTGHFFEQRFYSGALLDEAAVLAAMAYVDLNPVRAGIAEHIEDCRDTSIEQRLNNSKESIEDYLEPVVSGLASAPTLPMPLMKYTQLLSQLGQAHTQTPARRDTLWQRRLQVIGRRQRAYGALDTLSSWLGARGFRPLELALA